MSQPDQPDHFPDGEQVTFLKGKSGLLETITAAPEVTSHAITAIICHPHPQYQGTMHNKVVTTLHRCCRDLSIRTVRFNYRGVGHSEGDYDQGNGETDDLFSVIDWVKQVQPHDRLWLFGFSFGAGIVLRACERVSSSLDYLVCVAPGVDRDYFPKAQIPLCPWTVIQGEKDELVTADEVATWVKSIESNPPHFMLFPDVDHFFHGKLVLLRDSLNQILKTSLLKGH